MQPVIEVPTKVCVFCGSEFGRNPKHSRKQWESVRFCSRACGARWRAKYGPRGVATGACASCSKHTVGLVAGCCRQCYSQQRYAEKRDHILMLNRAWRERNPDYFKQEHLRARALRRSMRAYHGDLELHAAVLERDDYTCQVCGLNGPNRAGVTGVCVHHIDGDRSNAVAENLVVLCNSCHARVHYYQGDLLGATA